MASYCILQMSVILPEVHNFHKLDLQEWPLPGEETAREAWKIYNICVFKVISKWPLMWLKVATLSQGELYKTVVLVKWHRSKCNFKLAGIRADREGSLKFWEEKREDTFLHPWASIPEVLCLPSTCTLIPTVALLRTAPDWKHPIVLQQVNSPAWSTTLWNTKSNHSELIE